MTNHIRYRAYLLRLWEADGDEPPAWRASLEDPHTGQRTSFADLAQLFAYLEAQAQDRRTPPPDPIGPKPE
jgi:hypothetical protein